MNVSELMTSNPRAVRAHENLAVAAAAMWEDDCGALPVVDDADRVTGVLTDRDICMALATRNRPASEVVVGEVIGRPPLTCAETESIDAILKTMRIHQVRRLPVVDEYGRLRGIISVNDLILAASSGRKTKNTVTHDEVIDVLKGICGHADLPVVTTTSAGAVVVRTKKTSPKANARKATVSATKGSTSKSGKGK